MLYLFESDRNAKQDSISSIERTSVQALLLVLLEPFLVNISCLGKTELKVKANSERHPQKQMPIRKQSLLRKVGPSIYRIMLKYGLQKL